MQRFLHEAFLDRFGSFEESRSPLFVGLMDRPQSIPEQNAKFDAPRNILFLFNFKEFERNRFRYRNFERSRSTFLS